MTPPQVDPAEEFWAELRALYQAADSPTFESLSNRLSVAKSSLHEWVTGQSVPSRDRGGQFIALVHVLANRAGNRHQRRPDRAWEEMRLKAWNHVQAGRQRRRPKRLVYGQIPAEPPDFQARAESELVTSFLASGENQVRTCVLVGGRGVGKSHIAAEHVRACSKAGWELIAWVTGDSDDRLIADLAQVALKLMVTEQDADPRYAVDALREFFAVFNGKALLVIDNAVDPEVLRKWLPTVGAISVIITTTDHSFRGLGKLIEVPTFGRQQSLEYLSARTNLATSAAVVEVCERLGDLPLALSQAASVINYYRIGYGQYIRKLNAAQVADALPKMRGDQYPLGAAEALLLAVEAVEEDYDKTTIRRILHFVSVISPAGVGRVLLGDILAASFGWNDSRNNPLENEDYIEALEMLPLLVSMSILQWDQTGTSIIMHRLVGRVLRDRMLTMGIFPAAVGSIAGALPKIVYKDSYSESVEHILSLWDSLREKRNFIPNASASFGDCVGLARWASHRLIRVSDHARAIEFCCGALIECNDLFGSSSLWALGFVETLASAFWNAGLFDEASSMLEHQSRLISNDGGVDTRAGFLHMQGLAAINLSWQGRESEAIEAHKRLMSDARASNASKPEMLAVYNDFAISYLIADMRAPAVVLLERNYESASNDRSIDWPIRLASAKILAASYLLSEDTSGASKIFYTYLDRYRRDHRFARDRPESAGSADLISAVRDLAHDFSNDPPVLDMSAVQDAVLDAFTRNQGVLDPIDLAGELTLLPRSHFEALQHLLREDPVLARLYSVEGGARSIPYSARPI